MLEKANTSPETWLNCIQKYSIHPRTNQTSIYGCNVPPKKPPTHACFASQPVKRKRVKQHATMLSTLTNNYPGHPISRKPRAHAASDKRRAHASLPHAAPARPQTTQHHVPHAAQQALKVSNGARLTSRKSQVKIQDNILWI